MKPVTSRIATGAVAGAAGTLALDATTYLDMALRGRPASSTPEQTVARIASLFRLPLPEDAERRSSRLAAVGALLGMGAGVSTGVVLTLLRSAAGPRGTVATSGTAWAMAMAVGNGPMWVLGVTDPRTWSRVDWAADAVPHLAYAAAAVATLRVIERGRQGGT
ncbi:MAG TPA: hypothetical protein VK204_13170 [Nocardioidaceae bacterium]|nr:hypothetical protein [Nocardioidaceae bacterium]